MKPLAKRFDDLLAPYAVHNSGEHMREHAEPVSPDRLPFQRDRDRIVHSKAFRRLKHKTQVWVAGIHDHYRDRLTHSLEGAQIARGLCRNLGLNEDLAEAGILAHDLGHPPFGHEGEYALHETLAPLGYSFDHNQHSLRVVTVLEHNYPDFPGLNLTAETLNCLRKHEAPWEMPEAPIPHVASLEAQVVNLADEIAYYAHDIDDGLRAQLITMDTLFALRLGVRMRDLVKLRYPTLKPDHHAYNHQLVRALINILITDITGTTTKAITINHITQLDEVYAQTSPIVDYSPDIAKETDELRSFLYSNFYNHPTVRVHTQEGRALIKDLFYSYYEEPRRLPPEIQGRIGKPDPLPIVIKDYIAGMTDTFIKETVAVLKN
ncbi:MAG: dNTP triphosphohydrolase [Parcubacteria group bacterium]|nr:dNTP triphosphohydrolase [Parcubacteria group bacterium]